MEYPCRSIAKTFAEGHVESLVDGLCCLMCSWMYIASHMLDERGDTIRSGS